MNYSDIQLLDKYFLKLYYSFNFSFHNISKYDLSNNVITTKIPKRDLSNNVITTKMYHICLHK